MYMTRYDIGNEESIWLCDECEVPDNGEAIDSGIDSYGDRACDGCGAGSEEEEEESEG